MSLSSHLFPSPETEKPRETETNVGGGKQRREEEKGRLCEKKGISLDNAAFNFNAGNYGLKKQWCCAGGTGMGFGMGI